MNLELKELWNLANELELLGLKHQARELREKYYEIYREYKKRYVAV